MTLILLSWTTYWAFPEKNIVPPVENIDFFAGFPVKFTLTPLEFSIFLHWNLIILEVYIYEITFL